MRREQIHSGLGTRAYDRWIELSARAQASANGRSPCSINEDLGDEADRQPDAPTTPAYRLWAAENVAREAQFAESLAKFDLAIESGERASPLVEGMDFVEVALHHKGQAAAHAGQIDVSVRTFHELAQRVSNSAGPLYEAGRVLEMSGRLSEAEDLYRSASSRARKDSERWVAERASRDKERLRDLYGRFFPGPAKLAEQIRAAVVNSDTTAVRSLVSKTHFSTGVVGGHAHFARGIVLDKFCTDLSQNTVEVDNALLGSGNKRYLISKRWDGDWFTNRVVFSLTRSGRGWEWTGILITSMTDPWREYWGAHEPQSNQRLTLDIKAPWPAEQHFMAGGLDDFTLKSAAVAAAGLGAPLVALGFSYQRCGYGTRGFYYNSIVSPTHQDEDAFAIDFTRYQRGLPFDNESGGTPVLAVSDGIVVSACGGTTTGDDSASNTVEVLHNDPANGQPRFLSRYLHLKGPFQLSVSAGMAVGVGMRLGVMNDTGNSALDHLHFSIHDQNAPFAGAGTACGGITRGASVRPSPMDGQTLEDGDSGKCIRSSNKEAVGVEAVVGRITFLRAHKLGGGFGPPEAFLDSEIVVQLDSTADSYGLQLRRDSSLPAHERIFSIIRQAFLEGIPVRIEYVRATAADLRIIRVQTQEESPRNPPRFGGVLWRFLDALDN